MAADYKRFLNHVQLVDDKELYLTPTELPRRGLGALTLDTNASQPLIIFLIDTPLGK